MVPQARASQHWCHPGINRITKDPSNSRLVVLPDLTTSDKHNPVNSQMDWIPLP
jgi:hypothetical protein